MEMKNTLKCQWACIKRCKRYYIYIFVMYFALAFFDLKNKVYMYEINDYIYRYNFQQVCIIFSIIFVVGLLINEDSLRFFEDFIRLYVKDEKKYFYSALLLLSIANIVPFFIGQSLALLLNYFHSGTVPIMLFIVNIMIVSMEIVVAILLAMTFSLVLKKDILAYLIYFITTITLLVTNNVYIALPLTISILEEPSGYYITFDLPLWIGRIILLTISGILFHFAVKKIISKEK